MTRTPAEVAAEALKQHDVNLPLVIAEDLAQAALSALEREGYVLVPVEPTRERLDALAAECKATWGVNVERRKRFPLDTTSEWRERMKPLYRAMLSARPQDGGGA